MDRLLSKSKIKIMTKANTAFISTVLFSLKHSWNKDISTARVDGINIEINPKFFGDLSEDERVGLLLHESWHVCFNHMIRRGDKDLNKYNRAADYVINILLVDAGFIIPKGGLLNISYRGMSTEQVYDLLEDSDDDFDNDILEPCDASESDLQELESSITDIITKASIQSKQLKDKVGTIPESIERLIDEAINPKLPWNTILANYVNDLLKEDYSLSKVNRRYLPQDIVLPSLYSESLSKVTIAVDTSGSVSNEEFSSFVNEIKYIKDTSTIEEMSVIDFDTCIKNIHSVRDIEDISDITFTGGGGTDLFPVFEYTNKHEPTLLIVFSDLECYPIKDIPNYPVIWVVVNNKNATVNFGTKIDYET